MATQLYRGRILDVALLAFTRRGCVPAATLMMATSLRETVSWWVLGQPPLDKSKTKKTQTSNRTSSYNLRSSSRQQNFASEPEGARHGTSATSRRAKAGPIANGDRFFVRSRQGDTSDSSLSDQDTIPRDARHYWLYRFLEKIKILAEKIFMNPLRSVRSQP